VTCQNIIDKYTERMVLLKYLKLRYRCENNFVELSKWLRRTFKQCCKKFWFPSL